MTRTPGNRGALLEAPRGPYFEDYVTDSEALPAAPMDVDHVSDVTAWFMYSNGPDPSAPPQIASTGIGDCTFAALGELFNVTSAFSGVYPGGVHFPTATIVTGYSSCTGYVLGNPNTDNGAALTAVANWAMNNPLVDDQGNSHELAGWCQFRNPDDSWMLRRAVNLFGAVYMGYCLPDGAMDEFANEEPFADLSEPADPNEGHCMLYAFSDLTTWAEETTDVSGKLITWGAAQGVSPAWNSKYSFQALVLVTKDYIRKNGTTVQGLNLAQLLADSRDVASTP
jgi:hypothetical protein